MLFRKIYQLGDKLEDKVRGRLSHTPIIYAFVGGAGVVIFWRGVWHTADFIMEYLFSSNNSFSTTSWNNLPWWDGPLSIVIGTALLLFVGLFVSNFIGNEIIISGLKGEKKMVEKTEAEVKEEFAVDKKLMQNIQKISDQLGRIEEKLKK